MKNLDALQKKGLEILAEFSRVAEREGLRWFAMFGTLLGAVRERGFIPWDDDIDIALPRQDYDRLRLSCGWFDEPYFLQTPQNDPAAAPHFIRLRHSTTAIMKNFPTGLTPGGHMGMYIDIFPLDCVRDGIEAREIQQAAHTLQRQMLGSAALDEFNAPSFRERQLTCYALGGVAGMYDFFAERYENLAPQSNEKEYYAIPVLGGEKGFRVYEKSWFASSVPMEFENLKIPAPIGRKEILIVSYPDGLTLPPANLRTPKYSKDHIIDAENSYKTYTRRYTDMLRGIANKQVLIFGAGDSLRIWMERYSAGLNAVCASVVCAFDNSPEKWGKQFYGVTIENPEKLPELFNTNMRLIIASIYHKEIAKQLESLKINDYYIFIDGFKYTQEAQA